MPNEQSNNLAKARAGDIFAAADVLRRMMSELHRLRAATASPLLAMAIDVLGVREQLQELFETVSALAREAESRHSEELSRRAVGLIRRLTGELDYLARESERDYHEVPHGCDSCGTAN
jgi:hypothetical protein